MKRFFLLLFTLFLVGGLVYLLTFHRQQARDPLELVPEQAVLMLDWTDAAGTVHGFFASRFGRSLTTIDWPSVMEQLQVSEPLRKRLQTQAAGLMDFLQHPLFQEMFSNRIVAALLPVDQAVFSAQPLQAVADRLLLLASPKYESVLPRLLSLMTTVREETEDFTYQDVPIVRLSLDDGQDIYVAAVDGHLVISPGLATVQGCIDLSLQHLVRERTGIVMNSDYAQLKERGRKRDDFFLYADFSRLKPLLKMLRTSDQNGQSGHDQPEFFGTRRMVIFHRASRNIQQFTSIVQFDPDMLAPFQKTIYTREPVENRHLLNMPADLLVYFWSNWLDLPAWWKESLAMGTAEELAAAGRISNWIEKQSGMTIDEFLALFGQEFGFEVAEIRTSGFFPVPRICCCIELTDRDRVEQLLEKIITGLPVRRDKVAGIPVVSIMAAEGLMQPSYALLDRFLVMADSRKQIEDILKVSSKRLVNDELFQAVDMGMLQPSNLVVFTRTAEIIDGLKEFASWAGTMIAIRDEVAGSKSKILIDQVILPLLDGLKMFRAKGVRSYTAAGELVLDSVFLVSEPGSGEPEPGAVK
jgi:hypothetical protein